MGDLVLLYEYPLKMQLVQQPLHDSIAPEVDAFAVTHKVHNELKWLLVDLEALVGAFECSTGLGHLPSNAVLLLPGDVSRNRVLNYTLGDPSSLQIKLIDLPLQLGDRWSRAVSPLLHLHSKLFGNGSAVVLAKTKSGIYLRNLVFEGLCQDVSLDTALIAIEAEVVEVLSLGLGDAQPPTTPVAVEETLEEVIVSPLPYTHSVRSQNGLNLLKKVLRDKRIMLSLILNAAKLDETEVVALRQHRRHP